MCIADPITQACAGEADAHRVLHDIRNTIAMPDRLHEQLQAVLATDEPDRLRSFARTLQKHLEREVHA